VYTRDVIFYNIPGVHLKSRVFSVKRFIMCLLPRNMDYK